MEQQEKLIERLRVLPNNLIIVGPKYSGKKTLVSEVAPDFCWVEGKVENIRQIQQSDVVFADVDNWSPVCFSATLKMLEENTGHIIITCNNIMNLPNSIQSRCIIQRMEPYRNIGRYCDNIGQLQFVTDDMIKSVDKFEYKDEYEFDVFFTVLCNRLLERISKGEDLKKEFLISSKFNSAKNLKSLNKKQFILNWNLCMRGLSDEWKRL